MTKGEPRAGVPVVDLSAELLASIEAPSPSPWRGSPPFVEGLCSMQGRRSDSEGGPISRILRSWIFIRSTGDSAGSHPTGPWEGRGFGKTQKQPRCRSIQMASITPNGVRKTSNRDPPTVFAGRTAITPQTSRKLIEASTPLEFLLPSIRTSVPRGLVPTRSRWWRTRKIRPYGCPGPTFRIVETRNPRITDPPPELGAASRGS